jgi:hypothetical protein
LCREIDLLSPSWHLNSYNLDDGDYAGAMLARLQTSKLACLKHIRKLAGYIHEQIPRCATVLAGIPQAPFSSYMVWASFSG